MKGVAEQDGLDGHQPAGVAKKPDPATTTQPPLKPLKGFVLRVGSGTRKFPPRGVRLWVTITINHDTQSSSASSSPPLFFASGFKVSGSLFSYLAMRQQCPA